MSSKLAPLYDNRPYEEDYDHDMRRCSSQQMLQQAAPRYRQTPRGYQQLGEVLPRRVVSSPSREIEHDTPDARNKNGGMFVKKPRFKLFKKQPPPPPPKESTEPQMYKLSNNSGDSLELMPTLAMGFENSVNKKMKKSGELRITGDGYYFENIAFESEDEEIEEEKGEETSPREREFVHMKDLDELRGYREIQQARLEQLQLEQMQREQMQRAQKQIDAQQKEPRETRVLEKEITSAESRQIEQDAENQKEKKNLFRRFQDKRLRRRNREKGQALAPLALTVPTASSLIASEAGPCSTTTDPSTFLTQERLAEDIATADSSAENSSLVGVLGSVPILGMVFRGIDASDSLSAQNKLLLKAVILFWILYEIQIVFETLGSYCSLGL